MGVCAEYPAVNYRTKYQSAVQELSGLFQAWSRPISGLDSQGASLTLEPDMLVLKLEMLVLKGSVSQDFSGPFLACMDRYRSV